MPPKGSAQGEHETQVHNNCCKQSHCFKYFPVVSRVPLKSMYWLCNNISKGIKHCKKLYASREPQQSSSKDGEEDATEEAYSKPLQPGVEIQPPRHQALMRSGPAPHRPGHLGPAAVFSMGRAAAVIAPPSLGP